MQPNYYIVFGLQHAIVAEYPDTAEGAKQANAFMEAHTDTGLLAAEDGRLIIAALSDKGK